MLPALATAEAMMLTIGTVDFHSLPELHWMEQRLHCQGDWKRNWVARRMFFGRYGLLELQLLSLHQILACEKCMGASAINGLTLLGPTRRTDHVAIRVASRVETWTLSSQVPIGTALEALQSSRYVPDSRLTSATRTQRP